MNRRVPVRRMLADMLELVADNYRLAGWRASVWLRRWPRACRDDAEQEALLALVNAAWLWDAAAGMSFTTYAVRAIDQQVIRYLLEHESAGGVFRVPHESVPGPRADAQREARESVCRVSVEALAPLAAPEPEPPAWDAEALERAVARLPGRQREAARLFLGGMSQRQVAGRLGVSKTRAGALRRAAVEALRKTLARKETA